MAASILPMSLSGSPTMAQAASAYPPELVTDRPGLTESSPLVPTDFFPIELGAGYATEASSDSLPCGFEFPAFLIRIGSGLVCRHRPELLPSAMKCLPGTNPEHS